MRRFPIEIADMPAWAQACIRQVFGTKMPHCYISASADTVSICGSLSDNEVVTLVGRDPEGNIKSQRGTYGGVNPFSSNAQNLVNQGGMVTLPQGYAILEMHQGYKWNSAHLYVNPADAPKLMPIQNPGLTEVQAFVLSTIVGLKGGQYRRDAWHDARLSPERVQSTLKELEGMGLVEINKANAVKATLKARQVREEIDLRDHWFGFDFRLVPDDAPMSNPNTLSRDIMQGYKAVAKTL